MGHVRLGSGVRGQGSGEERGREGHPASVTAQAVVLRKIRTS